MITASANHHLTQADTGFLASNGRPAIVRPGHVTAWEVGPDSSAFVQLACGATVKAGPGDVVVHNGASGRIDVLSADAFAKEYAFGI